MDAGSVSKSVLVMVSAPASSRLMPQADHCHVLWPENSTLFTPAGVPIPVLGDVDAASVSLVSLDLLMLLQLTSVRTTV